MSGTVSEEVKRTAIEFTQFVEEKATRIPPEADKSRGVIRLGSFAVQGEIEGLPFDALNVFKKSITEDVDEYQVNLFYLDVEQKDISFDRVEGFYVFDKNGLVEFMGEQAATYASRVIRGLRYLDSESRLLPQLKLAGEEF